MPMWPAFGFLGAASPSPRISRKFGHDDVRMAFFRQVLRVVLKTTAVRSYIITNAGALPASIG